MASASPMASQLKSNFTSPISRALVSPRGISSSPLRVLPTRRHSSFTIKAIQSEKKYGQAEQCATLIFAYGTLKREFPNHALMEDLIRTHDAVFRGDYSTVERFPLVCGPHGIPFLINIPGSGHRVRGELYAVSENGLGQMDEFEGTSRGHYERLPVNVRSDGSGGKAAMVVEAEAYYAHRSFGVELWRRRGEEGVEEYTKEMGDKYVKREDRPPNWSFLGDIRLFVSSFTTWD